MKNNTEAQNSFLRESIHKRKRNHTENIQYWKIGSKHNNKGLFTGTKNADL